ncbi:MAG: murein biosynthesis integral membrane protein MurJ [Planctomycetes bacterium]|nr:murein biosynthesis integral membrane protein MurJ [Planctomycetota bacterium]MCW8136433.1 murein biosynthesis integral membrane protein MurJ [Planctomycetota bacterium]
MSGGQPQQPEALSADAIAAESVRIEEERRSGPLPATRSVIGSAAVVSGATLVSRVTGLVRDVMLAGLFGFSREMDVFFLAFTVPNLFRKLFGEGALSSATIPVLTRYRIRGDNAATRRYLGTISALMTLGLGALSALVIGGMYALPAGTFSDPAKFELFRQYLAVLLPYVVFICLAALQAGTLNCYNRFGVPALVPALANIGWIVVLVLIWLTPLKDNTERAVLIMALGVLATGVMQWAAQLPSLGRLQLLARPRLAISEQGVRDTFKAMAPMLFALAVFQVNTFLDQVLAELLVEGNGAVSSYSYASRLFQFPLGMVGVALGTAMFPLMSRFAADNELEKLTAALLNSTRLVVFIALPAAAGLAALAYPITHLLFGGANSEPTMLQRSALVLALLCISLPIVSVISLLTKAFYAMRDHKTPTRIALLAVVVNLVANVILLQTPLLEAGLALGTAISGAVNLLLLVLMLRRRLRGTILESMRAAAIPQASERLAQPFTPSTLRRVPLSMLRSLLIALVMAAAAFAVEFALYGQFGLAGRASRVLSVLAAVTAGVVVYAGASLVLKAPEVSQILTLRKRRATTPPAAS